LLVIALPGIAVRSKVPTGKGLKPLVPQHVEVRSYLRGAIYLNAELKPLLINYFSN